MHKQICIAVVLCCLSLTSSAEAVTVTRTRTVTEEITIRNLFVSVVRGIGFKLAQNLTESNLDGLQAAVETFDIELEKMEVKLSVGSKEKAKVALLLPQFEIDVLSVAKDFELNQIDYVSQTSEFWATVDGHRIHFRQELEYVPDAGFVRFDLKVLNSVGRVNRLEFYFDLYEAEPGEQTKIKTSLTIGACVPGQKLGLIRRIAARQISERSDGLLVTLDEKVREIITTDSSNFMELVPLLARRAIASAQ